MADYVEQFNPCCSPMFEKYRTSKFSNLRRKYRSDFEIIALMLEAMNDGAPRFSIMKHTSINSAQLKKYLASLIEMGFIQMDMKAGRALYRASEKGLVFLRHYYTLLGMLSSTQVQDTPTALFMNQGDASNGQQHSTTQIETNLQRTP